MSGSAWTRGVKTSGFRYSVTAWPTALVVGQGPRPDGQEAARHALDRRCRGGASGLRDIGVIPGMQGDAE